jgi:hypothetical protein
MTQVQTEDALIRAAALGHIHRQLTGSLMAAAMVTVNALLATEE